MDSQSLQEAADLINKKGYFQIARTTSYSKSVKQTGRYLFYCYLNVTDKNLETLKPLTDLWDGKIVETPKGLYKLIYSGNEAIQVIESIYSYLDPKQRAKADILIELQEGKDIRSRHSPEEKMRERQSLKDKLAKLNKSF